MNMDFNETTFSTNSSTFTELITSTTFQDTTVTTSDNPTTMEPYVKTTNGPENGSSGTTGAIVGGVVAGVVVIVIIVVIFLVWKKRQSKNLSTPPKPPPSVDEIDKATPGTQRMEQPIPLDNKKKKKKKQGEHIYENQNPPYVTVEAHSTEPTIYTREGVMYYMGSEQKQSPNENVGGEPEEEYGNQEVVRKHTMTTKDKQCLINEPEEEYLNEQEVHKTLMGNENKAFYNKDDIAKKDETKRDYENDMQRFRKYDDEPLYANSDVSYSNSKSKT